MVRERRRRDDRGMPVGRWVAAALVLLLFAILWWVDRTEPTAVQVEEVVELGSQTP